MTQKTEVGLFNGDLPYVRFGSGEEKLVVFPSLTFDLFDVRNFVWYFKLISHRLEKNYTIYVLGRKQNLSVGHSTREMAADYAKFFAASIGPATILGVSLGGMIAQYFANDYPQYVKKLILISSAHRLGPDGLQIARRWIPWSKTAMWPEIVEDDISMGVTGIHLFIFKFLKPLIVAYLRSKIQDPSKFIIAGQATIFHDSWDILPNLKMPVLIIAGTDDPFFPQELFSQMSERIPKAELLFFKGARHGVQIDRSTRCVNAVSAWLKDQPLKATDVKIRNGEEGSENIKKNF